MRTHEERHVRTQAEMVGTQRQGKERQGAMAEFRLADLGTVKQHASVLYRAPTPPRPPAGPAVFSQGVATGPSTFPGSSLCA